MAMAIRRRMGSSATSASAARRKFTQCVTRAPIPSSAARALVSASLSTPSVGEDSAVDPTRSASASIHRIT